MCEFIAQAKQVSKPTKTFGQRCTLVERHVNVPADPSTRYDTLSHQRFALREVGTLNSSWVLTLVHLAWSTDGTREKKKRKRVPQWLLLLRKRESGCRRQEPCFPLCLFSLRQRDHHVPDAQNRHPPAPGAGPSPGWLHVSRLCRSCYCHRRCGGCCGCCCCCCCGYTWERDARGKLGH